MHFGSSWFFRRQKQKQEKQAKKERERKEKGKYIYLSNTFESRFSKTFLFLCRTTWFLSQGKK